MGSQCGQSEVSSVDGGVERTGATALSLAVRGGFVDVARILLTVDGASWEVTLCYDPKVIQHGRAQLRSQMPQFLNDYDPNEIAEARAAYGYAAAMSLARDKAVISGSE